MFGRKTNLYILIWLSLLAAALVWDCVAGRAFLLMAIIAAGAALSPQVPERG